MKLLIWTFLTALLISSTGICNVPNFEVDASTSGERFFPDIYDNTVVWWEGGAGGRFVWYDWLEYDEGDFLASSSQPLHCRIYKRFIVWSDEFSADPNIYLADLVPDDTNDIVSLWISHPEDGEDITNGSVMVYGGALSLASEITNVVWQLYSWDGEFLDDGVADGTEEWSFPLELEPMDDGYDIIVKATDELGYFNEEEISLYKPDIVLVPFPSYNQDHRVIYESALTSLRIHDNNFFVKKILIYEEPDVIGTMNKVFCPTYFKEVNIENKIKMFQFYESQQRNHRSRDMIKNISILRGQQSNFKNAEGFEIIRWID